MSDIENVTVRCGARLLIVDRLLVRRTYEALLESRPDAAANDSLVQGFIHWVRDATGFDTPYMSGDR
jgi:hypothetical protein